MTYPRGGKPAARIQAPGEKLRRALAEGKAHYELLDERGNHLGTIVTTPVAPTFGKGAPTYYLVRLLRRAYDLGTRLGKHADGEAGDSEPEGQQS